MGEGKVEGDGAHHKQARGPKGGHDTPEFWSIEW